jgi:hypothetical protein
MSKYKFAILSHRYLPHPLSVEDEPGDSITLDSSTVAVDSSVVPGQTIRRVQGDMSTPAEAPTRTQAALAGHSTVSDCRVDSTSLAFMPHRSAGLQGDMSTPTEVPTRTQAALAGYSTVSDCRVDSTSLAFMPHRSLLMYAELPLLSPHSSEKLLRTAMTTWADLQIFVKKRYRIETRYWTFMTVTSWKTVVAPDNTMTSAHLMLPVSVSPSTGTHRFL